MAVANGRCEGNKNKKVEVIMFTHAQLWNSNGNTHLSDLWNRYNQGATYKAVFIWPDAYGNTPLHVLNDDVYR